MLCSDSNEKLKIDLMAHWIDKEWIPNQSRQDLLTLWIPNACTDEVVLRKITDEFELPEGFKFTGTNLIECPIIPRINSYSEEGELTRRTGAFLYRFVAGENVVEVLVMSSFYDDYGSVASLSCIPQSFMAVWTAFSNECSRLALSLSPTSRVVIIGGRATSFVPTVEWDDVILPPKLKSDLLDDVQSFFVKGIDVYKRLNLKPFRKLLLAGVPGTGKTMLCSALAKWALEQNYLVIYISSGDRDGSTFNKIEYALSVASHSSIPTLVILEELDAYLHEEEKALVLNVLDGAESLINDRGTLLVATTNYPEAIDERILKRPGRLDRVFIIPEIRDQENATKMLRQYLGAMWRDEHSAVVPNLVGYPGAFIREVAIYALTQVAYDDLAELSLDVLRDSFEGLRDQIEARDDFLTERSGIGFGGNSSKPQFGGRYLS